MSALSMLLRVAVPQHGLFTLEQAVEVGVGDGHVRQMAARGLLDRRSQGVYRIRDVPFNDRSEYMEAVLWAKGRAVVAGESALVLWDLADVHPRRIHLALPPEYRPRRRGGALYELHHLRLTPEEIDVRDGIPVVTPAVAIRQAIAHGTSGDLIEQAIRHGQVREHFGSRSAARLIVALDDREASLARPKVAV